MQQVKKRVDEAVGAPGSNEHSVESSLRLSWGAKVERRDRKSLLNTQSVFILKFGRPLHLSLFYINLLEEHVNTAGMCV